MIICKFGLSIFIYENKLYRVILHVAKIAMQWGKNKINQGVCLLWWINDDNQNTDNDGKRGNMGEHFDFVHWLIEIDM